MQPDTTLQQLLAEIRDICQGNADYHMTGGSTHPRKWMVPPPELWGGHLFDISGIGDAFDRSDICDDLDTTLQAGDTGSTVGNRDAKLTEIAYLGMMERAFRQRHQTATRSLLQTAGRAKGHGNDNGIHAAIVAYLQSMYVDL